MKTVNVYFYEASGKIVRVGSMSESSIELNLSDGLQYGIGDAILDRHYCVDGELAEIPEKPDGFYCFDYSDKTWVPDLSTAATDALKKRNDLLADGPDRINPIWWASMTQAEQDAWVAYRQALLDITSQPNYPMQVDWPVKPR